MDPLDSSPSTAPACQVFVSESSVKQKRTVGEGFSSQPNSDLMVGAPEQRSKFDQDITPRSAGRHGSTGSPPDVWGAQHSPFQESATSVNCKFDNTSTDWLINDPKRTVGESFFSQPNSDLMAGAPEHRSRFDQDITPRSAGRHGSTGSRPDVSGAQQSPFQESGTSVNCESDNTSTDWFIIDDLFVQNDHQMGISCDIFDFNEDVGEIETSVDVNEEKPEDHDQKPQRGMTFSSVTEAEEFYKNYAKKTGFTVRKGKIHKQPDGTLKWRRFLCSCEGLKAKKLSNQGTKYRRLDTRTGCEARMQVTLENEQWMITNLQLAHNHSLKNSNGSSDKSIQDTLTGPSEKLEGASEADTACPEHQLKQLKPQAVDSRRAKGETSLALGEAEDRDKTLRDSRRFIVNLTRLLKENHNEQLFEEVTKLQSIFHLHPKNQGYLPQQTQDDSVSSYSEQSMAKASDKVETPCNYVQNASDRLTMEERSLPVAKSADEELGLPSLPTIYSAQVPTTNDGSHCFGGSAVSIASSTIPTPTLPITTITSAGTPAAGSSGPHPPCLQNKSSGASRDQGKQCTSFGGVNTIVQVGESGVSHTSESIWQQILTRYGDITAKCTLTSPEFVAFVKQSILKIVELMQNNTARGLSDENISTIGRILGDLEHVEVKVDWLRTRFVAVGHFIDYAKAKDNRDMILRCLKAKIAEVAQLQVDLDQAEASLQELQHQVPEWLTFEDTVGKGLL